MPPRDTDTAPAAPRAKRVPHATELHGDTLRDDYAWLRDRNDPDVRRYLEAENAYTEAAQAHLAGFREALYKEMLSRIKETDLSVPYKNGLYWYYTRTVEGLQYPIFCRRPGSMDGAEQVTLDVNALAAGKPYMALGAYTVSENGRWLAYSTDEVGFRQFKLVVKDLDTGAVTPVLAERVTSVVWANDDRTLFYSTEDETTKRSDRIYRHRRDQPAGEPILEEPDELYRVHVGKTRSRGYVVAITASATTSEIA